MSFLLIIGILCPKWIRKDEILLPQDFSDGTHVEKSNEWRRMYALCVKTPLYTLHIFFILKN